MQNYFEDNARVLSEAVLPINADRTSWEVLNSPERLTKTFKFKEEFKLHEFVNELFTYQTEIKHHAKLTIDNSEVTVEVYTHVVEKVTELDKEYAKAADAIFIDVQQYEG